MVALGDFGVDRWLRSSRWAVSAVAGGAVVLGVVAPMTDGAAAVVSRPMAVPTAYPTSHAVIGRIDLPGSGFAENLYASSDDTVYVPTQGGSYVGIVNPGTTSGALDDSVAVSWARSVALSADDTLFVASYIAGQVDVFGPGGTTPSYSVAVTNYPQALALGNDGTLLVSAYNGGPGGSVDFITANSSVETSVIASIFGSSQPAGLAVDSAGNFYVGSDANSVKVIAAGTTSVSRSITGFSGPTSLGMLADDTLVVIDRFNNSVAVVPAGDSSASVSIPVGSDPTTIDVGPDQLAYVTNYSSNSLSLVDPVAAVAETIVTGVSSPHGVAVTSTGLIYIATNGGNFGVSVVAPVSGSLSATSGAVGDSVSVGLASLPGGVLMDDSTIESVWWGDDTLPFTRDSGANSVSVTVPAGDGAHAVVLGVRGGRALAAGTFTTSSAPVPPSPTYPPSGPRDVAGVPGDRSVELSWAAPASSGSFAVSNYQVVSSPAGGSCLTSSLSCSIGGLSNGTAYTFTVRALNGAGWGPWSAASEEVTPGPPPPPPVRSTIVITGTRGEVRGEPGIVITGTTTGMGMGAILRPWIRFPGQSSYSEGSASILVDSVGGFTWERRTGKKVYVVIMTEDASVKSNRLVIER